MRCFPVQSGSCRASSRWLRCEQRRCSLSNHRMPGTEIVRKQTVLGGAAGMALLAIALVYRFYPVGGHIVLHSSVPTEPTGTPDATLQSAPVPPPVAPVVSAPVKENTPPVV